MLITKKEWWKGERGLGLIRAVAQTAGAAIGAATILSEVNWIAVIAIAHGGFCHCS